MSLLRLLGSSKTVTSHSSISGIVIAANSTPTKMIAGLSLASLAVAATGSQTKQLRKAALVSIAVTASEQSRKNLFVTVSAAVAVLASSARVSADGSTVFVAIEATSNSAKDLQEIGLCGIAVSISSKGAMKDICQSDAYIAIAAGSVSAKSLKTSGSTYIAIETVGTIIKKSLQSAATMVALSAAATQSRLRIASPSGSIAVSTSGSSAKTLNRTGSGLVAISANGNAVKSLHVESSGNVAVVADSRRAAAGKASIDVAVYAIGITTKQINRSASALVGLVAVSARTGFHLGNAAIAVSSAGAPVKSLNQSGIAVIVVTPLSSRATTHQSAATVVVSVSGSPRQSLADVGAITVAISAVSSAMKKLTQANTTKVVISAASTDYLFDANSSYAFVCVAAEGSAVKNLGEKGSASIVIAANTRRCMNQSRLTSVAIATQGSVIKKQTVTASGSVVAAASAIAKKVLKQSASTMVAISSSGYSIKELFVTGSAQVASSVNATTSAKRKAIGAAGVAVIAAASQTKKISGIAYGNVAVSASGVPVKRQNRVASVTVAIMVTATDTTVLKQIAEAYLVTSAVGVARKNLFQASSTVIAVGSSGTAVRTGRLAQTITLVIPELYGGGVFMITAYSDSGLPVTISAVPSIAGGAILSGDSLSCIARGGSVTITADQAGNAMYHPTRTAKFKIIKEVPIIWWTGVSPNLVYGQTLTASHLDAVAYNEASQAAPLAGIMRYEEVTYPGNTFIANVDTTILLDASPSPLGVSHYIAAEFTPADTNLYSTVKSDVYSLHIATVFQATPVITWPAMSPASPGHVLTDLDLSAYARGVGSLATKAVPGTFVYSPSRGTVLNTMGNIPITVTFTPTDTKNYKTVVTTRSITIIGLLPSVVTWSNPANMVYGTPLSTTQLNATADVPGTFNYSPPIGTVLGTGGLQVLSVYFTPTDSAHYSSSSAQVYVSVAAPAAKIPVTWWPETINVDFIGTGQTIPATYTNTIVYDPITAADISSLFTAVYYVTYNGVEYLISGSTLPPGSYSARAVFTSHDVAYASLVEYSTITVSIVPMHATILGNNKVRITGGHAYSNGYNVSWTNGITGTIWANDGWDGIGFVISISPDASSAYWCAQSGAGMMFSDIDGTTIGVTFQGGFSPPSPSWMMYSGTSGYSIGGNLYGTDVSDYIVGGITYRCYYVKADFIYGTVYTSVAGVDIDPGGGWSCYRIDQGFCV